MTPEKSMEELYTDRIQEDRKAGWEAREGKGPQVETGWRWAGVGSRSQSPRAPAAPAAAAARRGLAPSGL